MTQQALNANQLDQLRARVIHAADNQNHSYVLKVLQEHHLPDCVAALSARPLVAHEFCCPHHHAKVTVPCAIQCRYRVDAEVANNCLLAYCHQQGTDRLNADEIAYLYGISLDEVQKALDSSMGSIRLAALQAEAAEDPDVRRTFSFVETTKLCAVCSSTTDQPILVAGTPLAYCSKECAMDLPPAALTLEWRFGRSVDVVLEWAVRRFKNLPLLERTFGLDRAVFATLTRRYLGKSLLDYFPKAKIIPEPTHIRTPDHAFDPTKKHLAVVVKTIIERHGPGKFSTEDLTSLLTGLLSGDGARRNR